MAPPWCWQHDAGIVGLALVTFSVCQVAFLLHPPEVYMDEIFHVPQAQRYCKGHYYEWDPKITTLPGLYIVASTTFVPVLRLITDHACEAVPLRLLNAVFSLITMAVMVALLRRRMGFNQAAAHAATMWLYPSSFFFTFLFYTDPGSTFFVLATIWLVQEAAFETAVLASPGWRVFAAALTSAGAIMFRQTNAVWCAFILGTALLQQLQALSPLTLLTVPRFALAIAANAGPLFWGLWPLLVPLIGFAVFVLANGSIVVGDKDHHTSALHLAQLAYCAAAAASMHISVGVNEGAISTATLRDFVVFMKRRCASRSRIVLSAAAAGLCLVALWKCSLAHPFTLSDNRHYTFYVWRRVLGRSVLHRCLLLPVYIYAAWLVLSRVTVVRSSLWVLMFTVVTALVLVPSPLIEPRYLNIPVLIAHLNSPQRSAKSLLSTALACALVNLVTVWVFLEKPFRWPDGSIARFMW
ncbi:alpha-2-glucosyltransferase Alg10 [Tribonema minus]|uniref:Dol-P-Glc:Glc(2)Man(9)GlcNAc(2)-PP-Dol alpha-1,2-glucosyltransferase n=1 Tax=Tribonema minus TaxID=303371 RepID=A0A835Z5I3_9STRA|nr:alpha-2-glucosyltransferase Alg10 [Tribonema minus]